MPARCAANASATEIAYSPAGPPSTPVLRLTTISLIMAESPLARSHSCHALCGAVLRQIKPSLLLLDRAVGVELADIGPQVVDLVRFLDAGEDHFGAGHHAPRVLDVFLEFSLIPDDARILVGVGILEVGNAAGMAAVEAVEFGADLVLRVVADRMARQALMERYLAFGDVLRRGRARTCSDQTGGQNQSLHCPFAPQFPQRRSRPFAPLTYHSRSS